MTAGLDSTGFTAKTLDEILTEIQTSERSLIDPALDFSSEKILGQLNGVVSEREALLWELVRMAMQAFDPDRAEGYLLEALSALTGTVRRAASKSRVTATVNLDATVTLPTGSVASVDGQPTKRFRTVADVTSTIAGNYSVILESEDTGPIAAPAGTLTVIAGPVGGWNSITNAEDTSLGRVEDTDAVLRFRRQQELSRAGSSTPDAIRADLLAVPEIEKVTVFENVGDVPDEAGLPPHSIEVLVYDGAVPALANNAIAQLIWNSRAAGAGTAGNTSGTAVDSEGVSHMVRFSRPIEKAVYVIATVDVEGTVPGNADDLLIARLVTEANKALEPGVDVIAIGLRAILFDTKKDLGYTWVNDVPSLLLGFSASPALGSNLAISAREIARLDTSRTEIVLT